MIHQAVADTLLGGVAYERPEFAALEEIAASAFFALVTAVLVARTGLLAAAIGSLIVGVVAWSGVRVAALRARPVGLAVVPVGGDGHHFRR